MVTSPAGERIANWRVRVSESAIILRKIKFGAKKCRIIDFPCVFARQGGEALNIVARFEIERRQFLDAHGAMLAPLPAFATDEALTALYRWMTLIRAYDAKAVALQRTGQLGTYAPHIGQEAINAAVASAMRPDDVLLPTYRENTADARRCDARVVFVLGG
jgi:hypothetical protein